jgi:hypothetical protein
LTPSFNSFSGLSGPPAIAPDGSFALVADTEGNSVYRIDLSVAVSSPEELNTVFVSDSATEPKDGFVGLTPVVDRLDDNTVQMILAAMGGKGAACPACNIIVEKVSGGDQMMCGCEVGKSALITLVTISILAYLDTLAHVLLLCGVFKFLQCARVSPFALEYSLSRSSVPFRQHLHF